MVKQATGLNLILKFLSASPSFKAYAHIYTLLLLKNKRIPFTFQDKTILYKKNVREEETQMQA